MSETISGGDLFCGGGGSSTGLVEACQELDRPIDLVAVNHWPKAVETHRQNHPWARHYCEEIRKVSPREAVPSGHLDILLAGAPCPHFSVARGGRPMNRRERATPRQILRWYKDLDVTGGIVENVQEFCFPADTMVWTKQGLLPIQDVQVGMKVLTHRNRWKKVYDVQSRVSDTVVIKGTGGRVEATENHRFYARKKNAKCWGGSYGRHKVVLGEPEWIPASELSPDRTSKSQYRRRYSGYTWASPTSFPKQQTSLLQGMDTISFWRLVGFWLGDGWVRRRRGRADGVRLAAHVDEAELVGRWFSGIPWLTFNRQRRPSVIVFETTSAALASWLKTHFGEHADAKTVPSWATSLPLTFKNALIEGYLQADGHWNKKDGRCRTATVSKRLALGMKAIIESTGIPANVTPMKISSSITKDGRAIIGRLPVYCLNWKKLEKLSGYRRSNDTHFWSSVRTVSDGHKNVTVYDLSVEDDHSFIADGFVVHNCTWGPIDSNGYPIKKRAGEYYRQFIGRLVDMGYTVEDRVLNSADYGAATTRKRLFIMIKKGRIKWPEPTHVQYDAGWGGRSRNTWRPGQEVIDWSIEGKSIFNRAKPLSKNTIRRISVGIERFCGEWAQAFLILLYGTGGARSIDRPLPTITSGGGRGGGHIALCQFVLQQQSGGVARDVSKPIPTVAARGAQALVDACLIPFYGEREGQTPRTHSLDEPLPVIPASSAKFAKVDFLVQVNHGGGDSGRIHSVDEPLKTIASKNGFGLASFVVKYFGTGVPHGLDEPIGTITAKDRFGLVECGGTTYGLDIRLRMLEPHELSAAMSFPKDYVFHGNRADKVRQIGNAWDVNLGRALCRSLLES